MYNYREAMIDDIYDVLNDYDTRDYDTLYDDLWIDDSVTGNGSGSYTFNRAQAEEYVRGNMDLAYEAAREFGVSEDSVDRRIAEDDWEYLDVTIRCYLLSEVLHSVLEGEV